MIFFGSSRRASMVGGTCRYSGCQTLDPICLYLLMGVIATPVFFSSGPRTRMIFSTHTEVFLPSCLITYRCLLSSCIPFLLNTVLRSFFKSCPGSFSNVAYFFMHWLLHVPSRGQQSPFFWDSHKGTPILMLKKEKYFHLHSV